MQKPRVITLVILVNVLTCGCCTILASTGYIASNPVVRDFLTRSGFGSLIGGKADKLYKASNFQKNFDQGTAIRKAEMDTHEILEIDIGGINRRSGHFHQSHSGEEDRMYSEKLFKVVNEMDRNTCISRLLCEIGAEPKSFGIIGSKVHHYIKSVPPVTWNSATHPYLEAFRGGLHGNKDNCSQHYAMCTSDLKRVMKYLWLFLKPSLLKTV